VAGGQGGNGGEGYSGGSTGLMASPGSCSRVPPLC
jgi:hypothetical protein